MRGVRCCGNSQDSGLDDVAMTGAGRTPAGQGDVLACQMLVDEHRQGSTQGTVVVPVRDKAGLEFGDDLSAGTVATDHEGVAQGAGPADVGVMPFAVRSVPLAMDHGDRAQR